MKGPDVTQEAGSADLEERIGHRIRRPELLAAALTHRSVATERPGGEGEDNERLEFLGDAVLSNTFGFGGANACLVFKRYSGA